MRLTGEASFGIVIGCARGGESNEICAADPFGLATELASFGLCAELLGVETSSSVVAVSAAPLDGEFNDLVRNGEIFVPMVYKMALTGGNKRPLAYTLGKDAVLEADHQSGNSDLVYKLGSEEREFIPQQRVVGSKVFLSINEELNEAGFYNRFLNQAEVREQFAFNFNRQESDLSYYSPGELRERIGALANVIDVQNREVLTATIEERSQGIVLWRWCLILALVFLAIEILLLRFWQT